MFSDNRREAVGKIEILRNAQDDSFCTDDNLAHDVSF